MQKNEIIKNDLEQNQHNNPIFIGCNFYNIVIERSKSIFTTILETIFKLKFD